MRRVKLSLACSLDLRIAGSSGEIDWIRMEDGTGMEAFLASIDTVIMGRKTYEFAGGKKARFFPGTANYVFSSTLPAGREGQVEIVSEDAILFTRALQQKPGKGIWIFGGHELAASLLAAELVDEIRLAVYPVLLGGGPPVFGALRNRQHWTLDEGRPLPSGVLLLRYLRAAPAV